jgi:hypothetical protein
MARQFHPTREDAVVHLIDCGFDLAGDGNFRRGNRTARLRLTKRGWVIDLNTVPAFPNGRA